MRIWIVDEIFISPCLMITLSSTCCFGSTERNAGTYSVTAPHMVGGRATGGPCIERVVTGEEVPLDSPNYVQEFRESRTGLCFRIGVPLVGRDSGASAPNCQKTSSRACGSGLCVTLGHRCTKRSTLVQLALLLDFSFVSIGQYTSSRHRSFTGYLLLLRELVDVYSVLVLQDSEFRF